jgi:hypothetical protein
MTIQYFQGLNIFVITELTIATLFARGVSYEASDVMLSVSWLFQQAHS